MHKNITARTQNEYGKFLFSLSLLYLASISCLNLFYVFDTLFVYCPHDYLALLAVTWFKEVFATATVLWKLDRLQARQG